MKLTKEEIKDLLSTDPKSKDYQESMNVLIANLKDMTPKEKQEYKVISMNIKSGDLNLVDNIECDICNNKGYKYYLNEYDYYEILVKDCSCKLERNIRNELRKSGLNFAFEKLTFESYKTTELYQEKIKEIAIDYVNNHKDEWFTILGQTGAGKTHICTAISQEMIKQGKQFKYLAFAEDMGKIITGLKNFDIEINKRARKLLDDYMNAEVLYIDDFLKVNVRDHIFELIDYRYRNNLTTIISSEYTEKQLFLYDEAVAGRILEKSNIYLSTIEQDSKKNYRMYGKKNKN